MVTKPSRTVGFIGTTLITVAGLAASYFVTMQIRKQMLKHGFVFPSDTADLLAAAGTSKESIKSSVANWISSAATAAATQATRAAEGVSSTAAKVANATEAKLNG